MSITPERLDELALEVASTIDDGSGEQYFVDQDGWITEFARALLAAVEAELVPFAWQCNGIWRQKEVALAIGANNKEKVFPLISLPLIKEKS